MWSLTSPRADRISGPEKFCSPARKDFFNSIGTFETCPPILRMSVHRRRPEVAVIRSNRRERFSRAMRLSPLDPVIAYGQLGTAHAHFFAERYEEASSWARLALWGMPDGPPELRITAASDVMAGRLDQAQRTMARMRQIDPGRSISNLADVLGPYRPEDLASTHFSWIVSRDSRYG